jgi:hypothetical protein
MRGKLSRLAVSRLAGVSERSEREPAGEIPSAATDLPFSTSAACAKGKLAAEIPRGFREGSASLGVSERSEREPAGEIPSGFREGSASLGVSV